MKIYSWIRSLIILLALLSLVNCKKESSSLNIKPYKNQKTFEDSVWNFTPSGDTIEDKLLGKWLSKEVRYQDTLCHSCDSLFTWIIESTGNMVERNNYFGDHETRYGKWEFDVNKKFILFMYEEYPVCGTCKGSSKTIIDSIKIDYSSKTELWTCESNSYGKPKMNIKFAKINK